MREGKSVCQRLTVQRAITHTHTFWHVSTFKMLLQFSPNAFVNLAADRGSWTALLLHIAYLFARKYKKRFNKNIFHKILADHEMLNMYSLNAVAHQSVSSTTKRIGWIE